MGGHGGLNILPQKSWHVYNYEAREKVRRDEEAHAAEEQNQRDRQLQVEGELRRRKLLDKAKKRHRNEDNLTGEPARLAANSEPAAPQSNALQTAQPQEHINLFEGVTPPEPVKKGSRTAVGSLKAEAEGAAEDAKHRLGYGCVSGVDGVAKPWYLKKSGLEQDTPEKREEKSVEKPRKDAERPPAKSGKKTIEQLRAERVQRENAEKERQRRLMLGRSTPGAQSLTSKEVATGGVQQRYNSAFGYGR
ncbi:hypothetical protein KFL_003980060 [Klebsormidium nitens]|uniref:CBF1-interacting co-repressor CIR N-terminal domain-containing protein n=1 Tax=Klebsormidium nitens TaxID=105231 RepID=A0A1Y1IG71_KLENI|nr:hypothetical protein KFL_003980060 [Klebsormidium nitens]|eukprot:GAQ88071.1 hypothetical protein KFL_003980060 [Klebsormidium nitens]